MEELPRTRAAIDRVMANGAAGAIAVLGRGTDETVSVAAGRSAPRRPLRTSTLVPWSCAGKPLLTACALRLVATGELQVDVPIQHWMPEYAATHPELTVRDLLGHQAAVDETISPVGAAGMPLHEWPRAPGAIPGMTYIYSSWWNWEVLGRLLENITGKHIENILEEEVLILAGMRHTTFLRSAHINVQPGPQAPDIMRFTPDADASGSWLTPRRLGLERRDASARMCGQLPDLVRFYRWIRGSLSTRTGPLPAVLLRVATTEEFGFTVGMKSVGFGKYCSPRSFGYGGAVGGANVVVGMAEPDHDFALAVAVNRIGRASAFALKAIVTAVYEDVLDR